MINMFLVGIIFIVAAGILFFQCSILWGGLASVCVVAIFVYRTCIQHKVTAKINVVVQVILGLLLLVFLFVGETEKSEQGIYAYTKQFEEVEKLLKKEEYLEAMEVLDTIDEQYGKQDKSVLYRAAIYASMKQFEEAVTVMEDFSDKRSREYYSRMEVIYEKMGESGEPALFELYTKAADEWPDWTRMQTAAGVVQLEQENYRLACYYLERAYKAEPEDGNVCYFLGTANYYLESYDTAIQWFEKALKRGVSEEVQEGIKYFEEEIQKKEIS